MLHKETIKPRTLELLKQLMADEHLNSHCLVGGTALALQLGHRISADLDLFTRENMDIESMVLHLQETYGFSLTHIAKNTIKGLIDGVKIDCIRHGYPPVEPLVVEEGIRLASMRDIAAMKLNAIVVNGQRIKDFIDIAYLSHSLTLGEMLDAYEQKYRASSVIAFRSLYYWGEIDFDEPVQMMDGEFDWNKITERLIWIGDHMDEKRIWPKRHL